MGRGKVEAGYLVPHPWDEIGPPPSPGAVFPTHDFTKQVEKIEELLKEANEHIEEAAEKRQEAQEEDDAVLECTDEALAIVEDEIADQDPTLAKQLIEKINSYGV